MVMQTGATLKLGKLQSMKADRDLIESCIQGDRSAFERLIKLYERKVFGLIFQTTRSPNIVEDLAQEIFVKVYFSLSQFRLDASFDAWLYRITINHCYDYLRKRQNTPQISESELSDEESQIFDILSSQLPAAGVDHAKRFELKQIADKLLGYLPPLDRSLLVLKEVEELSIDELAKVFKLSKSAIKLRLFRARNRLKEEYYKLGRNTLKGKPYERSI
jgi:RNA polymerase sigma-70 factor, ECF subfamily